MVTVPIRATFIQTLSFHYCRIKSISISAASFYFSEVRNNNSSDSTSFYNITVLLYLLFDFGFHFNFPTMLDEKYGVCMFGTSPVQ